MNTIELTKVVDAVRATPDEHFDMSVWQCGSQGCAIGAYCAANPAGPLQMVRRDAITQYMHPILRTTGDTYITAVAEHFDISSRAAAHLFDPDCYDDEEFVAKEVVIGRLENFIASGGRYPAIDDE